MELFLSVNIHQGNDLFSVYSRDRQCAFMSLSALFTARNNQVVVWSKTTLNDVLLQGAACVKALNNGLIVPDPGVDLTFSRIWIIHIWIQIPIFIVCYVLWLYTLQMI